MTRIPDGRPVKLAKVPLVAPELMIFVAPHPGQGDPMEVAAFKLAGGTTGVQKIIPWPTAWFLYNMRSVFAFNRWTVEDRVFVPMPSAHNLNIGCGWGPFLVSGGAVIATLQVDPAAIRQLHTRCDPL